MYQAAMVINGIGAFLYAIGFIIKNIFAVVNYPNVALICSIMLVDGFICVGMSIFFMIYITHKIHSS